MPSPREIEIKLELEPGDLAALKTKVLPELGAVAQGTTRLLSVYFDTDRRALRKRGVTLRVRSDGGRIVQTVKADTGASAGMSSRAEWAREIDGQEPRLDAAADSPLAQILAGARGPKRLRPIFETSIDRTRWAIETEACAIEIALDEGQVRSGALSATVSDVELELKRGEPAHLFDVARRITAHVPARLGMRSKAERGYGLRDGKQPRSVMAETVPLTAGMTTAKAFQTIMRNCIRQFRLNEPLLVARHGAEALHQARVAIRRLRAALSLFKGCVTDDDFAQIRSRLGVISDKLGEARDLDIYLRRCERTIAAAELVGEIEARREAAYQDVISSFDSVAFRHLLLDLMAWIECGAWLTSDDTAPRDVPITDFASDLLETRRRKLRKAGRQLKTMSPHARHRVRIEVKKLHYATEFFASLVASKKGRRRQAAFLAAVQELQACLGDLNDIETGKALATAIVRDLEYHPRANPRALIFAAGHVSGRQAAGGKRRLRRARKAYLSFVETPRFWAR